MKPVKCGCVEKDTPAGTRTPLGHPVVVECGCRERNTPLANPVMCRCVEKDTLAGTRLW